MQASELLDVVVAEVHDEAPGIRTFVLRPVAGQDLAAFAAGDHIDVHLGNGLIRQYSLFNGPESRDRYEIGVKKEPESRGGSRWMHEQVRPGDALRISRPKNNFPLKLTSEHYVLAAGGIGITPILSMARHLAALSQSFELHYFVRSQEHAAFKELIAGLAGGGGLTLHCGLSVDETGAALTRVLSERRACSELYLCGPGPFMDSAVSLANECAWPAGHVHLERFSAPTVVAAGDSFRVRLVKSQKEFEVPAGRTIIRVLADNGVEVPTSCESGVCGTCLTDVVGGVPDHRDVYLTDEEKAEGRVMCPCVSRSRTSVLELNL